MRSKLMLIRQLDKKLDRFHAASKTPQPSKGWVQSIRSSLHMSFRQLGQKMQISAQAVKGIEEREQTGGVTLKTLRDVAQALDMQLVYGFVPNDGSLEAMIERKAIEAAQKIVQRTNMTMKLEDQANTPERIKEAIRELSDDIKKEVPKYLWD